MNYIQEPRENEMKVGDFYDALNATNKEYAALSWNGFNLWGDRKSIKEVNRLIHKESFIEPLQNRLKETQDRLHAQKEFSDKLQRELDGYKVVCG